MTLYYSDVIMGAMAFQITSLIVNPTVHSGVYQRKYQRSASLAFVREIHRWPVNSAHKRPVTRNIFPFDDVIISLRPPIPHSVSAQHIQLWSYRLNVNVHGSYIYECMNIHICCRWEPTGKEHPILTASIPGTPGIYYRICLNERIINSDDNLDNRLKQGAR